MKNVTEALVGSLASFHFGSEGADTKATLYIKITLYTKIL